MSDESNPFSQPFSTPPGSTSTRGQRHIDAIKHATPLNASDPVLIRPRVAHQKRPRLVNRVAGRPLKYGEEVTRLAIDIPISAAQLLADMSKTSGISRTELVVAAIRYYKDNNVI